MLQQIKFLLMSMVVLWCSLLVVMTASAEVPGTYHEGNYHTSGGEILNRTMSWNYVQPDKWPQQCLIGRRQSPITFVNVDPEQVKTSPQLRRLHFSRGCHFPGASTDMEITNSVNRITVKLQSQNAVKDAPSACTVTDPLNKNDVYHFDAIDFHIPPEHLFSGDSGTSTGTGSSSNNANNKPDIEMHIFFDTNDADVSKTPRRLVVAVLLKATSSINTTAVAALKHILVDGRLPPPHAMTTCTLNDDIPLVTFLPDKENYLLYDGSLTRPPCTEGVRWVVMTSPIFISHIALGRLQEAMRESMPNDFQRVGNARPPQALNGRLIYRYIDNVDEKEDRKEAKHNKNNNNEEKKSNKHGRQVQNALTDSNNNNEEDEPVLNNNDNINNSSVSTVANRFNVREGDLVEVDLFDNSTHVQHNGAVSTRKSKEKEDERTFTTTTSTTKHPESQSTSSSTIPTKKKVKKLKNKDEKKDDTSGHTHKRTTFKNDIIRGWHAMLRAMSHAAKYMASHMFFTIMCIIGVAIVVYASITACRVCRRPRYVVGVEPAVLEPLNARYNNPYYGTG